MRTARRELIGAADPGLCIGVAAERHFRFPFGNQVKRSKR